MTRSHAARPAAVATLASALVLAAFGALLASPMDAQAKSKPKPKPASVRALLATNLSEAGGSKIAIRLASPAPKLVKILVSTSAAQGSNAATAGVDFKASSQWVTIKQGSKIGYFTPKIINDNIDEPNELLHVHIVKTSKWAKLPTRKHRSAIATIRDNDAAQPTPAPAPAVLVPSITVSDSGAQIIEGDNVNATARFKVTLDAPTTVPVSAPYSLADGSALAGLDFAAVAPGTLTFAPGVTELTIDVPVIDDTIDEDTEKAQLTLGTPTGATLAKGAGELSIFDDEQSPSMAIKNIDADEGTGQSTIFPFEVKLSHPSSKVITMTTYTLDLSATGAPNCAIIGADYVAFGPKVITFQPGEMSKPLPVKVCGDNKVEQDEFFALPLTELTNAIVANPQGVGQIENDD